MKFLLALLLIALSVSAQRQTVTTTTTTIATTTVTSTVSTSTACVHYTDAVSACRRRRQYWIEQPIISGADDQPANQFINPHPVQRVQTTLLPNVQNIQPYNRYSAYTRSSPSWFVNPGNGELQWGLQPSIVDYRMYYPYGDPTLESAQANFRSKDPIKKAEMYLLLGQLLKIPVLVTNTVTATSTTTVTATTTTKTNTVTISGCRPPAITYQEC